MINDELNPARFPSVWRLLEDSKRQIYFLRKTLECIQKDNEEAKIMKGVLLKCARKNLRKPLIDSDKIFFYYLCSGEIGVNFIYGKIAPYWKALDQSNFGREAFRLSRQIYEIVTYGNIQNNGDPDGRRSELNENDGYLNNLSSIGPYEGKEFSQEEAITAHTEPCSPTEDHPPNYLSKADYSGIQKERKNHELHDGALFYERQYTKDAPIKTYSRDNNILPARGSTDERYEIVMEEEEDDNLSDLSIHQISDINALPSSDVKFSSNNSSSNHPNSSQHRAGTVYHPSRNFIQPERKRRKLTEAERKDPKRKQCKICGKHFATRSCLNRHIAIHKDIWPHACTVCGKAFRRSDHMKAHVALFKGKNHFFCRICNRTFRDGSLFKRHSKLHCKQPPLVKKEPTPVVINPIAGRVTCRQCGKHVSETYIHRHERLHSKTRYFSVYPKSESDQAQKTKRNKLLLYHI
ncbi:uncharacterized protein LOC141852653 isoform X2 [Brevipalpus obovatus]